MPELPEVETIRRALEPHLAGAVVEGICGPDPRLRRPVDLCELRNRLQGKRIESVRRRGKFLLLDAEPSVTLLIHLGMTGRLSIVSSGTPAGRYERVGLLLEGGRRLCFADVRRFGFMALWDRSGPPPPCLAELGPEPLGNSFSARYLYEKTRNRTRFVHAFLTDQRILAGLGNIYANEALFAARISPARPAGCLNRADCARLVRAVRSVLRAALEAGGTTIRDYRMPDGTEGAFAIHLQVYARRGQPCLRCGEGTSILRATVAGRSVFFCPSCQR